MIYIVIVVYTFICYIKRLKTSYWEQQIHNKIDEYLSLSTQINTTTTATTTTTTMTNFNTTTTNHSKNIALFASNT